MSQAKTPITIAYGDGIGPEIMRAVLRILEATGASLAPEVIQIGESVYQRGISTGIEDSAWESLRRTRIFLKAPITTPQGGGFKSLNVTVRKTLGLYANVRPTQTYHPYVRTSHAGMDVVVFRENEEDLYAGIEHRQCQDVFQALKLISIPGSEKLIRHAFEYSRQNGRKKISCFTKDNIMKFTDGEFHRIFDEVAAEYPDIETDHWILDIGMARVADTPELFDVICTLNLYGDVLSDITAQIAGSVGLGGSANLGDGVAMFEAIHGSAPPIAGRDIANPSGLLQAAVLMLVHIGQAEVATRVQNAWLKTIEDGVHTADVAHRPFTQRKVGTQEFGDAVIERLGQEPVNLKAVTHPEEAKKPLEIRIKKRPRLEKLLVGIDVFLDAADSDPSALGETVSALSGDRLFLKVITNRGVKVWPEGYPETFCSDHWRCRFGLRADAEALRRQDLVDLLGRLVDAGHDVIKTENLYLFDGERGFSLAQGESE